MTLFGSVTFSGSKARFTALPLKQRVPSNQRPSPHVALADGRYGIANGLVCVASRAPGASPRPTAYTFRVSGCEKVAPGVVTQSFEYQCPVSQPQLLISTEIVGLARAVPASWICP